LFAEKKIGEKYKGQLRVLSSNLYRLKNASLRAKILASELQGVNEIGYQSRNAEIEGDILYLKNVAAFDSKDFDHGELKRKRDMQLEQYLKNTKIDEYGQMVVESSSSTSAPNTVDNPKKVDKLTSSTLKDQGNQDFDE